MSDTEEKRDRKRAKRRKKQFKERPPREIGGIRLRKFSLETLDEAEEVGIRIFFPDPVKPARKGARQAKKPTAAQRRAQEARANKGLMSDVKKFAWIQGAPEDEVFEALEAKDPDGGNDGGRAMRLAIRRFAVRIGVGELRGLVDEVLRIARDCEAALFDVERITSGDDDDDDEPATEGKDSSPTGEPN